jgi:hypothetical protein
VEGKEFAKGDTWSKMRARQAGHLKGIRRREEEMSVGRQTGVIRLKQRGPILEVSLEGVLFPVHGRGGGLSWET